MAWSFSSSSSSSSTMSPHCPSSLLFPSNSSENDGDSLFEIEDYLISFHHEAEQELGLCDTVSPLLPVLQRHEPPSPMQSSSHEAFGKSCMSLLKESSSAGEKGSKMRVAFKTKSEHESLDDGYKWRKYGKKMVKDSPHPRNYYRCANERCNVKKRVERLREDSSYVITTYEGIHNHQVPSTTSTHNHHRQSSIQLRGFS